MSIQEIPIDTVRIDGGTQARAAISNELVAQYVDALTDGVTLPPVMVFFDGATYWLADGFHRWHANHKIGATTIAAAVRPGTQRDAVLFSVGANGSHGLPPNNADKRKAVMLLLADAEWSAWSDREVAKQCHVSHTMVQIARRSLATVASEESPQRTYTTKHGTESTMDTAGQKDAAAKKKAGAPAAAPEPVAAPAPAHAPGPVTPQVATAPVVAASLEMAALVEELASLTERLAECTAMLDETLADNEILAKVVRSSDPLGTAIAEIKSLKAQVAQLREAQIGLMNGKNEAIRLAKSWKRKAEGGTK